MRPFSSSSEWMEEGFGPWKGLTLWKGWWSVGRAGAPFLEPISAGDAKFKAVVGEKEGGGGGCHNKRTLKITVQLQWSSLY